MSPGSDPQEGLGIHIGTIAGVLESDSGALARSRGPGDPHAWDKQKPVRDLDGC